MNIVRVYTQSAKDLSAINMTHVEPLQNSHRMMRVMSIMGKNKLESSDAIVATIRTYDEAQDFFNVTKLTTLVNLYNEFHTSDPVETTPLQIHKIILQAKTEALKLANNLRTFMLDAESGKTNSPMYATIRNEEPLTENFTINYINPNLPKYDFDLSYAKAVDCETQIN